MNFHQKVGKSGPKKDFGPKRDFWVKNHHFDLTDRIFGPFLKFFETYAILLNLWVSYFFIFQKIQK